MAVLIDCKMMYLIWHNKRRLPFLYNVRAFRNKKPARTVKHNYQLQIFMKIRGTARAHVTDMSV